MTKPSTDDVPEALRARLTAVGVRDGLRLSRELARLPAGESGATKRAALANRIAQAERRVVARRERLPKVNYPEALPITARKDEIVATLKEHPVTILVGATGSGKTTQLPKMLLEAGFGARGRIACTQPRRVAALSVSQRIAEEMGVPWGAEVGAKIRFTDRTDRRTIIKMVTDGMLLAEAQKDPDLSEYEAVIVDEAHERSLNIDFLLGYLRQLRERRPDLRIVITSATIEAQRFADAFAGAPVIEVSGRTWPVEVRYRPLEELFGEDEDITYIEGAVRVVEDVLTEGGSGDVLVFMPTERDIRETCQALEGRTLGYAEVLPLFGRLASGDQQRVFARTQRRKIIVSTNIAETSLTLPGIRFVVDTGLARLSRYNPQTRTQRLPVEPIAQSSAEQRKGRSGRVRAGVCVRLYSEADFLQRPEYPVPEIQRCNLASVILTLKAYRFGDIRGFPFLDPPHDRAIRGGYQLLSELGALDDEDALTPLGRELASLPLDPTIGRLLLAAREQGCLREVMVIAAALSIQDPRERPTGLEEKADREHSRFYHHESDFLTLLNLWDAYHDETERLSLSKLRRFAKAHYLNFNRLREWRDIYHQIERVLGETGDLKANREPAAYHLVHQALLAGLLSHVAMRDEGNTYRAPHNRRVMLFPGSVLYSKEAAKLQRKQAKGQAPAAQAAKRQPPDWIVAGEWVETQRIWARTCAKIDPSWILHYGRHLCKTSYSDPRYEAKARRVLVKERITLHGLPVRERQVGFSKVDAAAATEIFIRSALVDAQLDDRHLPFLEHNRKLREALEEQLVRLRRLSVMRLDEAVYAFYARQLENVSSAHELSRAFRERGGAEKRVFYLTERDLLGDEETALDTSLFPERTRLGEAEVPVVYRYKPGEDEDGVTLQVPVTELAGLDLGQLDWAVPGLFAPRIEELLRTVPKAYRKQLFPVADKVAPLADEVRRRGGDFLGALSAAIWERYAVHVPVEDWNVAAMPSHLQPRVEILDTRGKPLESSREAEPLVRRWREQQAQKPDAEQGDLRTTRRWREACKRWERDGITGWDFGDLPKSVSLGNWQGLPRQAFLGIVATDEDHVAIRLHLSAAEARAASAAGVRVLLHHALGRSLDWLQRDLRDLQRVHTLYAPLGSSRQLREDAYGHVVRWLDEGCPPWPLTADAFKHYVASCDRALRGVVPPLVDRIEAVLQARQQTLLATPQYPGMEAAVEALVPPDFLQQIPFTHLADWPRYLEAQRVRAQRAARDPQRDAQRKEEVRPFAEALNRATQAANQGDAAAREAWPQLRRLFEEFRVSVFAQELGTAERVSTKRLREAFAAWLPDGEAAPPSAAPGIAKPPAKKAASVPQAVHAARVDDLRKHFGR